jgi:hypothetical protein
MVATAKCKNCGAAEDTWEHALIQCTMSRCVWAQLDEEITELLATLHISDPMHWVLFLCNNIPQVDDIKILVTCWAIWYARRKTIHGEIFQNPLATFAMVNRLIKELPIIKGVKIYENHIQPKHTARQWTAPERGHYKINVDAAISRVGAYGAVAAICRGDQGEFIAASVRVILHITDPETLEVISCSEALAEDCGIGKMIVTSDCLCFIKTSMRCLGALI